jgi:hypothetical protein
MQYGAGIDITPDGAFGHLGGWAGQSSFMTTSTDHHTTIAASCNSDNAIDTLGPGACKPSGTTDLPIHTPRDTPNGQVSPESQRSCGE